MRAAVFEGNGRIDVREVSSPVVTTHDGVVIRVAANAICGTDLHALDVPPTVIFRPGVVIGHEFAGTVVEAGKDAGVRVGDRVGILPNITCGVCDWCKKGLPNLCIRMEGFGSARVDGGAAEFAWAPGSVVFKLPEGLSMELATIAEPLSCVLNGTLRAGWQPDSTVVVLGGGPIGLMYAMIAKTAGVRSVTVVEMAQYRRDFAESLGCEVVDALNAEQMESLRRRGADYVIDAVGVLIAEAVAIARPRGTILMFGLDDTRKPAFPQADAVRKEVRIEGVFLARNSFALALELLARPALGFDRLITHKYELAKFDDAVAALRTGQAC
jgi:(R,R)-butanediol dehydrogenase/meso-butanediol dehydrogenase/diacetyl reductase